MAESIIGSTFTNISYYIKKAFIFIFIFIIFTGNLFALSISLQCNRSTTIFMRLTSGLFAFMFGFLYIILNYYMYRIKQIEYPCLICDGGNKSIFSLS